MSIGVPIKVCTPVISSVQSFGMSFDIQAIFTIYNYACLLKFLFSQVLHEAEGHVITCETNTGEVYRGKLIEAEDNMNIQMSNINVTYRDGRVSQLENVFIRGSKIRFLILPDMLKNAPMFKKVARGPSTVSRGKNALLKAQVARGRGRARAMIVRRGR